MVIFPLAPDQTIARTNWSPFFQ